MAEVAQVRIRALARPAAIAMRAALRAMRIGWLCGLLAMLSSGCDAGDDAELAGTELPAAVTVPSAAPVCEKDARALLVFAAYATSACGGGHCPVACGETQACPAGSACTDGVCAPAGCEDDNGCASGTRCDRDTHTCELFTCAADSTCPCGSYCDAATQRCRLDCLTGADSAGLGLGCNGTLQCDGRGRCSSPTGSEIPTQEVVLATEPAALELMPDPAGAWSPAAVTARLTTTSALVGGQPPRAVRVEPSPGLLVACDATSAPTSGACTISGWAFALQGATYTASRALRVSVADGDSEPSWTLTLTAEGLPPRRVQATRRSPAQESGRYRGELQLDAGDPETRVPVEATVTATAIMFHDPAGVIAANGAVLVKRDGAATITSFLGTSREPQLYERHSIAFQIAPPTTFDAAAGRLTGRLTVRLASSPIAQAWTYALTRSADLTTICPAGEVLDPAVAACIPGNAWDPMTSIASKVTHRRATAWLDAMAPRLADPRLISNGAAALAERLVCYDTTSVSNPGLLNQTLSNGVAGDLQCAGDGAPHGWWSVGLLAYQDRSASAPPVTQPDMLAACLQQITRAAPTTVAPDAVDGTGGLHNDSCVSLARFFPALFTVAGSAPYRYDALPGASPTDSRSRLLFVRLLQQWAQLTGFLARDGAAQRAVADILSQLAPGTRQPVEANLLTATQGANVSYGALLDAVDDAWTLILDERIRAPLVGLPAAVLANPDYRQARKPLAYWTFAAVDRTAGRVTNVAGGTALTAAGACAYDDDADGMGGVIGSAGCGHHASVAGLDQNLTAALHWTHGAFDWTSTLVDSDALVVQEVVTPGFGPELRVGHRVANGTVQLVTFQLDGRPAGESVAVIRRDARARVYSLTRGAEVLRRPYVDPPAIRSDQTVSIGASRTVTADHLKGVLGHVALWSSALADSEARALASAYFQLAGLPGPSPRPAWPAEVVLPGATDRNANEPAVGLPAMLLEGLIPTLGLVEAYLTDAALANQVACRRGVVDDSLPPAKERAARTLRLSHAIQQLAVALRATAATAGPLAWTARYNGALAEVLAARSRVTNAVTSAVTCENPMRLGAKEYPLYFAGGRSLLDSGRPVDLLEASAAFLREATDAAIQQAGAALTDARSAWAQQFSSGVQQQISDNDAARRVADVRSSFGRELIDLCGAPVTSDAGAASSVLGRFLDAVPPAGRLTVSNCHVQETAPCAGNEATPLAQVNPACFRGQVGEAWLATQSARERVTRASAGWFAARATHDGWLKHCAERQAYDLKTETIINSLKNVEIEQARVAGFVGLSSGLTGMIAGVGTGNPVAAFSALGQLQGARMELLNGFAARKAKLNAMLQLRNLEQGRNECWFQADLARAPLEGAEQEITVAMADLQVALVHAATLRNRVAATVSEAAAAVAREAELTRPRIAFHYWADEKLEIYQRRLARARRMTYLFQRAVEHDLQRRFEQYDDDVLGAPHPELLTGVATALKAELAHGFELRNPGRLFTVLSLCNDVLRLPELLHETDCNQPASARRFREILFSPANAVYQDGTYVGQSIPFRLTPSLARSGRPGFSTRCAERLAEVDAQFVGDFASLLPLKLAKRETFYSETCSDHVGDIGPFQDGTLHSSNNLLLEGAASQFGRDRDVTRGSINALPNGPNPGFETSATPSPNAIPDLAGRGLFGDYALIVPPEALAVIVGNSGGLHDIKVRFDFISIEDSGGPPFPGTRQLAVELRDGDGNVVPSATGNAVSATCASCAVGELASLTATAASGWHFAGWTGACAGAAATCTAVMDRARTAVATFVDDRVSPVHVTALGTGTGGVAAGWAGLPAGPLAGANVPGDVQIAPGRTLVLTAHPAPDSTFTGWSGACAGTGSCALGHVQATQNVTATFARKPRLSIHLDTGGPDPWGRVIVSSGAGTYTCEQSDCSIPVNPGEQVQLFGANVEATFATWQLVSWSGACVASIIPPSGAAPACALTMTGDVSVTAVFRRLQLVSIDLPGDGRVTTTTPSRSGFTLSCGANVANPPTVLCAGWFLPGAPVTFVAAPFADSQLAGWTGDAAPCGLNRQCTLLSTGTLRVGAVFVELDGGGDCLRAGEAATSLTSNLPSCP